MVGADNYVSKNLLGWFSHLLSGPSLKALNQQLGRIQHSRSWRLQKLSEDLGQRQEKSSTPPNLLDTDTATSIEKFAYAMARFPWLRSDPVLLSAEASCSTQQRLPLFAALYWLRTPSLQLRYPLPWRRLALLRWWESEGPPHWRKADRLLRNSPVAAPAESRPDFRERRFGVNLIGHAFNVMGLGENLRMVARALDAAEVPYGVVDIPLASSALKHDPMMEERLLANEDELPYAFSVFCMTAESQLHLALHKGMAPGPHTYTISIWFWETERWPEALVDALDLADEFWPCTRLIETALRGAGERLQQRKLLEAAEPTIRRMPPVMSLDFSAMAACHPKNRLMERARRGFNAEAVLFCFIFDLNSFISRKNPQAVLRAFQKAFDPAQNESVGLVIKTFRPSGTHPAWDALKAAAAADPRIHIIEADLDRASLLALLACCDSFVSLHRSEGLGQGLMEALQLGLDVIATDYGGNTDFCVGPLAHPIPYRLIPIQPGEYPHHQGMVWAEPDEEAAVAAMRKVADRRRGAPITPVEIVDRYRQEASAQLVGSHYRSRLEQLWQHRNQIQEQLDTLVNVPP